MNFKQEMEEKLKLFGNSTKSLYNDGRISREQYDLLICRLRELEVLVKKYRFDQ